MIFPFAGIIRSLTSYNRPLQCTVFPVFREFIPETNTTVRYIRYTDRRYNEGHFRLDFIVQRARNRRAGQPVGRLLVILDYYVLYA